MSAKTSVGSRTDTRGRYEKSQATDTDGRDDQVKTDSPAYRRYPQMGLSRWHRTPSAFHPGNRPYLFGVSFTGEPVKTGTGGVSPGKQTVPIWGFFHRGTGENRDRRRFTRETDRTYLGFLSPGNR